MSKDDGIVGVSDHGGWAVFVTAGRDGTLLDRRRVELVDGNLPKIPHHSEAQALPLDQAVALVERVRASAERHAALALDAVATTLPGRILGVALRRCPELPPTIGERITDYRAQNVADWVMYRKALAAAAEARGWAVHWYDAKQVLDAAGDALRIADLDAHFLQIRRTVGPPWSQDHRIAMAAAIVAFAFVAQTTPDFSGLWQLNLEKSTFRGPAPKEILVRIQHHEPTLIQTMLIVAADGSQQQRTFTYDTNNGESAIAIAGGEGQSRAHWSGSELIIESVLKTPNRTFHFSDHWSLSSDRQTLRMAHPDDDLAGQIAILEKASPDAAARFKPQ
jgi:hypothetical protein